MNCTCRPLLSCIAALLLAIPSLSVRGHAIGPLGVEPLAWQNEYISQVVGGGSSAYTHPSEVKVEGRDCVRGASLHFNVRDEYAFDMDEAVHLEIQFYVDAGATQEATLTYERSDAAPPRRLYVDPDARRVIQLPSRPSRGGLWTYNAELTRAHFANGGFAGTDFSIEGGQRALTICAVAVRRSYTTAVPTEFGTVAIEVFDERGQQTPARLGLYDQSGRLPLPGPSAIPLRGYNGTSRIVSARAGGTPWPMKNHSVFYIGGHYRTTLPAGRYSLVVAKGPEYHMDRQALTIEASTITTLKVHLRRWKDMATSGWYSGDGHIHYTRESPNDDRNLLVVSEAEDLHLANILEAGNSGTAYFRQYGWQEISKADRSSFVLVPGQEDPRTSRRGHTTQLNLKGPIRIPARYLLYHEVFAQAHAQGAVNGYAHATGDEGMFGAQAGLALDVPFGLVDFVEVLQLGTSVGKLWFDFLNLGYKLSPSAGTDYPYADLPGAVRNYVYVGGKFTPQSWFDGLKAGRTFVTNGPMLEFTVNHQAMGSDLSLKSGDSVVIEASATMNPEIDEIDRLELIEQGDVVNTVHATKSSSFVSFKYERQAKHGSWFIVRCFGKHQKPGSSIVAVSAPIYIHVDGQGFWRPAAVPEIVERFKKSMNSILTGGPEVFEGWDTHEPDTRYWEAQEPLLEQRIQEASTLYDDLVRRAREVRQ